MIRYLSLHMTCVIALAPAKASRILTDSDEKIFQIISNRDFDSISDIEIDDISQSMYASCYYLEYALQHTLNCKKDCKRYKTIPKDALRGCLNHAMNTLLYRLNEGKAASKNEFNQQCMIDAYLIAYSTSGIEELGKFFNKNQIYVLENTSKVWSYYSHKEILSKKNKNEKNNLFILQ